MATECCIGEEEEKLKATCEGGWNTSKEMLKVFKKMLAAAIKRSSESGKAGQGRPAFGGNTLAYLPLHTYRRSVLSYCYFLHNFF